MVSPYFLVEWTNDVVRTFYEVLQPRTRVSHDQWTTLFLDGLTGRWVAKIEPQMAEAHGNRTHHAAARAEHHRF